MKVNDHICLHCGACVGTCPSNSIFLLETSTIEFLETCTECGQCAIICPVGAISDVSEAPNVSEFPQAAIIAEARP